MTEVRYLTPADTGALTALYRDYEWWVDHRGEGLGETLLAGVVDHPDLPSVDGLTLLCRRGLVPFYESVRFELFDPEMAIPVGGTEVLVRMTHEHDG